MARLDLHTHSTASDGHLTPASLVAHAAAAGVTTLALTDHDTLAGLDEATRAAMDAGVVLVPGVELTVQVPHGSMHLLAYLPSIAPAPLLETLTRLGTLRTERIARIVERLNELGLALTLDAVHARAAGQLGRPHVAEALVAAGHAASVQDAFDRWLGDGLPAHVPQRGLEPDEAVGLVRECGGVPVLAHPASLRLPERHLQAFVQRLAARGLWGVEVHRPEHLPDQRDRFARVATRLGLVACGGSDFHRPDGPFAIGDTGHPPLPAETADRIQAAFR